MYTYLIINIAAISIPFVISFDRRNYFFARWKYLFPAIAITGLFFILWDMLFTEMGIWGFNPRYLTGIYIVNLPLEEVLFFITIPFACVFTYDTLKYLVRKDLLGRYSRMISFVLAAVLLIIAVFNISRTYTSVTFILTALFILYHELVLRFPYMGRFYLSYLILLLPFFIINGILTGSFIDEQVVWYDDSRNLSFRIFTIPVEDIVYGLFLILMNVSLFEYFRNRGLSTRFLSKRSQS